MRKGTSLDKATLNSEEIKAVAIAIIKLRLFEYISKGGRESVSQPVSRKFDQIENILNSVAKFWNELGMI